MTGSGRPHFRMSRLEALSMLNSLGSLAGTRLRWAGARAQPVRGSFCLILPSGYA